MVQSDQTSAWNSDGDEKQDAKEKERAHHHRILLGSLYQLFYAVVGYSPENRSVEGSWMVARIMNIGDF